MNSLLIPGNPPAVSFYEDWAREIVQRQPSAQVRVSAYPLPPRGLKSRDAMARIADHHVQNLKRFSED